MHPEVKILLYALVLIPVIVALVFISKTSKYKVNDYFARNWKIYTFISVLLIVLTLPFHYVPSRLLVFPKNSLTFRYTIITESSIDKLVKRYNNAVFIEKIAIRNEPITRSLIEKGIIRDN